jgi:hypothetical protein
MRAALNEAQEAVEVKTCSEEEWAKWLGEAKTTEGAQELYALKKTCSAARFPVL